MVCGVGQGIGMTGSSLPQSATSLSGECPSSAEVEQSVENPAKFYRYGNKDRLNPAWVALAMVRFLVSFVFFLLAIVGLYNDRWFAAAFFALGGFGIFPRQAAKGTWHGNCPGCKNAIVIRVENRNAPAAAINCPICTRRIYAKNGAMKLV